MQRMLNRNQGQEKLTERDQGPYSSLRGTSKGRSPWLLSDSRHILTYVWLMLAAPLLRLSAVETSHGLSGGR